MTDQELLNEARNGSLIGAMYALLTTVLAILFAIGAISMISSDNAWGWLLVPFFFSSLIVCIKFWAWSCYEFQFARQLARKVKGGVK